MAVRWEYSVAIRFGLGILKEFDVQDITFQTDAVMRSGEAQLYWDADAINLLNPIVC